MILKGDCIFVMKAIKPNSVDAIVCDPPYGLQFMGKEWDKLWRNQTEADQVYIEKTQKETDGLTSRRRNLPDYKATNPLSMQLWHTQWLTEAYKVLKPGGSMLVMGGTRTSHRLACAIEDSGFIIKDTLMWLYGSGFPKAQDLGKMIDKRNGRKAEDYKQLGNYLKEQRLKKGLNTNDIGKNFPSRTGGITGCYRNWEYGNNVPTAKQYSLLKDLLKLNYKFDWLIEREEAEREIIGDKVFGDGKTYPQTGKRKCFDQLHPEHYSKETAPSTDLAKHWDGFKVGGIKPAYEPIIWAVKPPEGSYVDNVLKWQVGAINVDECRIGTSEIHVDSMKEKIQGNVYGHYDKRVGGSGDGTTHPKGRFPANVILDEEAGRLLDEQSGNRKVGTLKGTEYLNGKKQQSCYGAHQGHISLARQGDSGGASRFFKVVDLDDFSMYNKMLCKYNINGNILEQKKGVGMLNGVIRGIEKSIQNAERFGFGKNHMENFQRDLKLIISTSIKQMIEMRILLSCSKENIKNYMVRLGKTIDSLMELSIEDVKDVENINSYFNLLKEGLEHSKAIVKYVQKKSLENGELKTGNIGINITENIEKDINRFFYCAKASRSERNAGLEGMGKSKFNEHDNPARVFNERDGGKGDEEAYKPQSNNHPTVKPIKLFEYLIKLVTREGQIVLDPFMGSGTTAIAAHNVGRKCVGIEKEDEYLAIAKRRIDYWKSQPKQMEMRI